MVTFKCQSFPKFHHFLWGIQLVVAESKPQLIMSTPHRYWRSHCQRRQLQRTNLQGYTLFEDNSHVLRMNKSEAVVPLAKVLEVFWA